MWVGGRAGAAGSSGADDAGAGTSSPAAGAEADDSRFLITRCIRRNEEAAAAGAPGAEALAPAGRETAADTASDGSVQEEKILAAYWRNGKFGAAYFNIQTCELFVLDEIVDRKPEHQMLCNLFRQVRPVRALADGHVQGTYKRALNSLIFTQHSLNSDNAICKLVFLPSKEYSFEACKRRIYSLSLPHEPRDCTEEERKLFLRTILNFSHAQSAHALGALLKYLDLHWSSLDVDCQHKPDYMSLRRISLADIVTIDEETYKGLQIFSLISHPSNFKKGIQGSGKEGLSLFRLFNKCSSKVGSYLLRVMMQHPTRNIGELTRRQDAIAFCNNPQNDAIIRNICSSLKFIKNVSGIMAKVKSLSAKPYEWKSLYNTLYHTILICEVCENSSGSELIEELGCSENKSLYEVALCMNRIIDFDLTKAQGKFTVKPGIDAELDKKKQVMSSLHGLMSETAKCELEKLPQCIEECTMVYIPHLGYLLGVKAWDDNLTIEQKELSNLKFMFQNHDYIHYKSKGCEELDVMIGDTYPEIMAHETRIMMRLASEVMENLQTLSALIQKCAELDCLIAISKVCKDLGFVRPAMSIEKVITIRQGKHPLQIICSEYVVPNDTSSTAEEGYVKVLTGPNSSGKSVYLKQVALIVYLAHIGSFVPADHAEIGIVSHIYTRIQSVECIASHMSAFLIDLRQMSLAIQECSSYSLVVIDEFGKGTSEVDGLALLSACLNTFLFQDKHCPHLLISTHFLNIKDYMIKTPLVKFQRLEHIIQDGELIFLFRLIEGLVESSFAHEVAKITGIEDHIVTRAKEVMKKMLMNTSPQANQTLASSNKSCTQLAIREISAKEV